MILNSVKIRKSGIVYYNVIITHDGKFEDFIELSLNFIWNGKK